MYLWECPICGTECYSPESQAAHKCPVPADPTPDAVEAATGVRPPLPAHLADLFDRTERFEVCANDFATVRGYIEATLDHA